MIDYDFYLTEYMGNSIPDREFPRLSRRAWDKLNQYKRLYEVTAPENGAEGMAVCAMADAIYYFENAQSGDGTVSSASIGSVSVSYANNGVDLTATGQEAELYRTACMYLDIYRGCG